MINPTIFLLITLISYLNSKEITERGRVHVIVLPLRKRLKGSLKRLHIGYF
jgi:hypothetical protein